MAVRIDNDLTRGWQGRVPTFGTKYLSKMFPAKEHGWRKAKTLAEAWEADQRKLLDAVRIKRNRKPQSNNQTGTLGVHRTEYMDKNQTMVVEWVATWSESGKPLRKSFLVTEGRSDEKAEAMAKKYRKKMNTKSIKAAQKKRRFTKR